MDKCNHFSNRNSGLTSSRYPFSPKTINSIKERFVAFDTETTGLSPSQDRIIQIGAVSFENGRPVKRFSTFVDPLRPIPTMITEINRISDEMVKGAPTEDQALADFFSFLRACCSDEILLCGHNISFDLGFLDCSLKRTKKAEEIRYLDTLSISRKILFLHNHKQVTVARHYGLGTEGAHRADCDAEICGSILLRPIDDFEKTQ